jgi:hypothetical protein
LRWLRNSYRFPKQTPRDLMWLRNAYIVFGVVFVIVGVLGLPEWPGYGFMLIGILWFAQSFAARKEIGRRRDAEQSAGE